MENVNLSPRENKSWYCRVPFPLIQAFPHSGSLYLSIHDKVGVKMTTEECQSVLESPKKEC